MVRTTKGESMKLKGAVIGAGGYWGRNYIRILSEHPDIEQVVAVDKNLDSLNKIKEQYPNVLIDFDIDGGYDDLNFAIVVTPVTSHYEIVKDLLVRGVHTLCEKAFTETEDQAQALIDIAYGMNKVLAVGHTFLYNSIVQKIKWMIDDGELGDVYYVSMTRMGNSPHRNDVGCATDLLAHDISMLLYWFGEMPKYVSAFGKSYLKDGLEDISVVNLEFSNNVVATMRASWINPIKRRNITIVGSKKMIAFDDVERTLEIYEGDKKEIIPIEYLEPLREQVNDFINCIKSNQQPFSDGTVGKNVVAVLNQCQKSMLKNKS